jgi:hypothetical protein
MGEIVICHVYGDAESEMFHKAILLTAIKISTRSQNKVDYTSSQVL